MVPQHVGLGVDLARRLGDVPGFDGQFAGAIGKPKRQFREGKIGIDRNNRIGARRGAEFFVALRIVERARRR